MDPKYQGRGAGAHLVRWGSQLAEDSGIPLYLEASPSTWKLYEKLGYERLPEKVVHKAETLGTQTDIEVPLMVKWPRSQQQGTKHPSAEQNGEVTKPPHHTAKEQSGWRSWYRAIKRWTE